MSSKKILGFKGKTPRADKLWREREENVAIYLAWRSDQWPTSSSWWGGEQKRRPEGGVGGNPVLGKACFLKRKKERRSHALSKGSEKWAGLGSCLAIAC